jgi:choline-sulfatase
VRDHGVSGNDGDLPHDLPTFPQKLRDAGYHTAMIGKCDIYRDRRVKHVRETIYRMNQYGFEEAIETGGQQQTATVESEYTDFLKAHGKHYYEQARDWSAMYNYRTRTIPMWHTESHPLPVELYLDSWVGQRTARWIDEYEGSEPWFMWTSFPGPHDPWDAPWEFVTRYAEADIPPANNCLPDTETAGPFSKYLERRLAETSRMTDDSVRAIRRFYYANIELLDIEVGRILAALESKGDLENTWIIFTSDHGEMLGDHGLITKQVFYESSVRIPLIIRPPSGIASRVEVLPVEQVDLSATIRAIAGAEDIPGSPGQSLLGHFETGSNGMTRDLVVSANLGYAMFATPRYKLAVDEQTLTPCQLFDLEIDPREDRNLVRDDGWSHVLDEMMAEYVHPFFRVPAREAAVRLV